VFDLYGKCCDASAETAWAYAESIDPGKHSCLEPGVEWIRMRLSEVAEECLF